MALIDVGARLHLEGRRELAREAQGAEDALRGVGTGARDAQRDASGLASEASGLEKALGAVKVAGVAAAAAVGTGFASALGQGRSTDRLAASLGLDPAQSAAAGAVAGELYADAYGESFDDVTTAVDAVMSTMRDLDPEEVERVTAATLDLASAFGLDTVRAASSAGIAISSGLARDADHAVDLMAAAMQRMPAHMREELLEATDEYGPFLAQLGLSGEEAFGLLASASEGGMYSLDKTGDSLKELTIRATDMSAASVTAYEAAGLSADDMAARFLAGGDSARGATNDLIAGLLGIEDPVLQANSAIALFGTPIEDLSVSEIPEFLASLSSMETSLGDVGGSAVALGDTLNDNAATRIEQFKRETLGGLSSFIGDTLIPQIEDYAARNEDAFGRIRDATSGIGDEVAVVPSAERDPGDEESYWQSIADSTAEGTARELEFIERHVGDVTTLTRGFSYEVQGAWAGLSGAMSTVLTTLAEGAVMALGPIATVWDAIFGTDLSGALTRGQAAIVEWRDDANAAMDAIQTEMEVNLDTLAASQRVRDLQGQLDDLRVDLSNPMGLSLTDAVDQATRSPLEQSPVFTGDPGSSAGGGSGGAVADDADSGPISPTGRPTGSGGGPSALGALGRLVPPAALSGQAPARMPLSPTPATVPGQPRSPGPQVAIGTVAVQVSAGLSDETIAAATGRQVAERVQRELALARGRR